MKTMIHIVNQNNYRYHQKVCDFIKIYNNIKSNVLKDEDIENGSQMNLIEDAFMFVPEIDEEQSSEVDNVS